MAYALVARRGSAESCNCGLTAPKDTDNHIVLVDPALKTPTLTASEDDSVTAEFTPRAAGYLISDTLCKAVKQEHPNTSA